MKRLLMTAALAAVAALPAAAVEAKGNGNGNGKGHAKVKMKEKGGHGKAKAKIKQKTKVKGAEAERRSKIRTDNGKSEAEVKFKSKTKDGTQSVEIKEKLKGGGAAGAVGALGAAGAAAALTADDEVLNLINCPPGLAKKDPPCVPPGLAKKGVTAEEWTSYDRDELRQILRENDDAVADVEIDVDEDLFLTEQEIITTFGLEPPEEGYHYSVIDGQVVLLDAEDYQLLQQLRTLATPPGLERELVIEPTVALSEEELIAIYDLPDPEPGKHYAVVDGTVVLLETESYDLLQLIRITAAA